MPRKQKELAGIEQEKIPGIEDAADGYVTLRDKWQAIGEKLIAAKTELLEAMHTAGVKTYRFDDYIVELEAGKEKVKVKKASDPDDEDDD